MIILGSNLSRGPVAKMEKKYLFAVGTIRLFLAPLIAVLNVKLLVYLGLVSTKDRILHFVLMMENASPTATQIALLAQLFGNAKEMVATMFFWQYLSCVVTTTIWVYIDLYLAIG